MDLLQIALLFLITFVLVLLSIGGWIVFLILRDLRKALVKLNEVLYGNSLITSKIKQGVNMTATTKKMSSKSDQKIFAPRRFFKKSN